jgi:urocanate hydratase
MSATLQFQTLRHYGELIARRPSWAGQLVFTAGEGSSATGLATAVSIAGGCTLALDPDADTVKSVFRQGGIDFVVNTLDEAIRVLKNEIRQHKPLSVALISPLQPVLDEIAERGLHPDLDTSKPLGEDHLTPWLARHGWTEISLPAANTAALRALDQRLLDILPADDQVRRRWVQRISHYLRPSTAPQRTLWLTPMEQAAL